MPFLPLAGTQVVDVTTSIAGPFCAEILGALGADVVKVERPDTGDDGRAWGPPFWSGESAMFLAVNAGKRSLAISLRDERGRDALLRLADQADVFLQSLRPGLAEQLGLGPDTVRSRNPRLVYCSVGAYGRTGPLSGEPGYDALMQAAGGLVSMTGEPGRPGVRVGSSLIDMGTGMWSALGVVAALLERERTGEGALVDTSLYETALAYVGYHLVGYLADGTVPTGQGTVFPMVAPYQVFPTRDGELMVAGGNDRIFAALCGALGLPELVDDSRFRTNPDRVRNREGLVSLLSERLRERDTADWQTRLIEAGVPAAPVADVADVVEAEQTQALGMLQAIPHSAIPELQLAALPLSVDEERAEHRLPPPQLGEHSAEVLREIGYKDEEIAALAADGVVRLAEPPRLPDGWRHASERPLEPDEPGGPRRPRRARTSRRRQTQPTQPTEPTEPTQPTEPAESVEPTEPIEPAEPVESTQPTEPTEPIEPEAAAAPEDEPDETTEEPTAEETTAVAPAAVQEKGLRRSRDDRVIAGVCGGLGKYLGIDPVLVRIAALLLIFAGGVGILLYIIGWIAIDEEPAVAATAYGTVEAQPAAEDELDRKRGAVVLGLVFVALGIFFLLDDVWPDLSWQYVWPIALIAVGFAIVARARK